MTDLEYLELQQKISFPDKYGILPLEVLAFKADCKEYNKELIKEFPFLMPKSIWTGLPVESYNYSYTELDCMPTGWRKAFGIQMCQEIKDALLKAQTENPEGGYPENYYTTNYDSTKVIPFLEGYTISQIKEKYGALRWYDLSAPQEVHDIADKYEKLSEDICQYCGKPAKYQTTGWITNLCEDCFEEYLKDYPEEERAEMLEICKKR